MAIDRHNRDDPAAHDAPGAVHGDKRHAAAAERPVPEERRSRGELYADLRNRDNDPERQPPPGSPDASRKTDDGGWEWKGLRLTPEANRIADQQLSARRGAEGRADDGSYGDRGITPAMRRVEAGLEHGTLVPDTEKFALKSPDRFKEKLAKMMERYPERSPSQLSSAIHDGARYTFVFDTPNYVAGVSKAREKLTNEGYQLRLLKPSWDDPDYKGINSRWRDAEHEVNFEVQFHTPESWEAKQATHDIYEKMADPRTDSTERSLLEQRQRKVTAEVAVPDGAEKILYYSVKETDG
jgi:hypothetical protein